MIPVHTLIVEDEDAFSDYIEARLSRASKLRVVASRVRTCADMKQALQMKGYDIVLLDLSLPDSHGVDTVAAAVKLAPNTPIVVLSGHEDMEVATVALRSGAQDFVVKKPGFTTEDLERPMLYALMRAKNENDSKRLYMASRRAVSKTNVPPGYILPSTVEPYFDHIEEMVEDIRRHLRENSPSQAEAVENLLEQHRFWLTLKDARSTLHLEKDRGRRSEPLDLGEEIIDRNTPVPVSRADAERMLLDVLGRDVPLPSAPENIDDY